MSTLLTAQQISNEALRHLEKALSAQYKPRYEIRFHYGKYAIYKKEWKQPTVKLAKGLTKAEAEGMMKLLKEEE